MKKIFVGMVTSLLILMALLVLVSELPEESNATPTNPEFEITYCTAVWTYENGDPVDTRVSAAIKNNGAPYLGTINIKLTVFCGVDVADQSFTASVTNLATGTLKIVSHDFSGTSWRCGKAYANPGPNAITEEGNKKDNNGKNDNVVNWRFQDGSLAVALFNSVEDIIEYTNTVEFDPPDSESEWIVTMESITIVDSFDEKYFMVYIEPVGSPSIMPIITR